MISSLVAAVLYLGLLVFVLQHNARQTPASVRLLVFCSYSALLMVLHALILGNVIPFTGAPLSGHLLGISGLAIGVALVISLTLVYLGSERIVAWRALPIAAWVIAILSAELLQVKPLLVSQSQLPLSISTRVTLGSEIALVGWVFAALMLIGMSARAFLKEPLPLSANRILFWTFIVPILLLGDLLSGWLIYPWYHGGYALRLLGTLGAAHAILVHRVLDLREVARWLFRRSILVLVTGILVLASILLVLYLPSPLGGPAGRIPIALGVALLAALLYQPIYAFFSWLTQRLVMGSAVDPAEGVRLYAQKVSGVIDLQELADIVSKTINQLMATRRGYLILATYLQDQVTLEVVGSGYTSKNGITQLSETSPIYNRFKTSPYPLLQYDIDYHQDFQSAPETERRYFSSLEMDVYAPIVSNDARLVGLLALGPKANDAPFRNQEVELLTAIAHQTVVALENARLVDDLRGLNEKVNALNEEMRSTNQRLERLDAVKTDFITIASHELRTPLTQIQGYADLMYEMFQHEGFTRDELQDMIGKLTRACGRMTEVVTSMLDVAQIDIEVMDLTFEEVSLVTIFKQAIEPYTSAIQSRRLTLISQGMRQLPPIYGDTKRLAQAFENLVTNAIKYTPDGGKITITGQILGTDPASAPQTVQIIIADTGIGIDHTNQQLIFDKFYRVDPVELHSTGSTKFKGGGAGLGLSIAKGIVEGHGGRIWVESRGYDEEGLPGSHFNVVLPIRPPAMDIPKDLLKLQSSEQDAGDMLGPGSPFTTRPGLRK